MNLSSTKLRNFCICMILSYVLQFNITLQIDCLKITKYHKILKAEKTFLFSKAIFAILINKKKQKFKNMKLNRIFF